MSAILHVQANGQPVWAAVLVITVIWGFAGLTGILCTYGQRRRKDHV